MKVNVRECFRRYTPRLRHRVLGHTIEKQIDADNERDAANKSLLTLLPAEVRRMKVC